jgi:hypothetical protein
VNMDNRDAVRLKANNFDSEHGCGSIGRCSTCMADFAIKIRDEALATYRAEVAAALKEARQDNALMFPDVKGWKPITAFDHGVHQAFYTIRRYLGLNTVRKHLGQGEKEAGDATA